MVTAECVTARRLALRPALVMLAPAFACDGSRLLARASCLGRLAACAARASPCELHARAGMSARRRTTGAALTHCAAAARSSLAHGPLRLPTPTLFATYACPSSARSPTQRSHSQSTCTCGWWRRASFAPPPDRLSRHCLHTQGPRHPSHRCGGRAGLPSVAAARAAVGGSACARSAPGVLGGSGCLWAEVAGRAAWGRRRRARAMACHGIAR